MTTSTPIAITIETTVKSPASKIWSLWSGPEHIIKWCSPSPEWHTPKAVNDLRPGGKFNSRMEARDGSFGFDFGGTYDIVKENEYIEYTLDDARKVKISFQEDNGKTHIVQTFDAENVNSIEQQRTGWQAILDNFKIYVEAN